MISGRNNLEQELMEGKDHINRTVNALCELGSSSVSGSVSLFQKSRIFFPCTSFSDMLLPREMIHQNTMSSSPPEV